MKLSVIIVNYNVKYFIEQAIVSVQNALSNINGEIIVVDNHSTDGSVEMIRKKFPRVILIANTENKGFSAANNQGIRIARGEYILLLNPDTVVQEDTFEKTLHFMDTHPEAGALGVKMLDGKGNFLPESKRGLPTPIVAFYKTFGLSSLFPKSRIFNRYHLGFLDENEIHEVDVLAGAFMLIRKSVLDKIGLLDEDYFMYGEDIDLSYRIIKAGYKNYYFPEARIIHYKGESTKKGSLNYVRIFYQAMLIFARKHFSPRQSQMYYFFIYAAIYLRAFMAAAGRLLKTVLWPATDVVIVFAGMYRIKNFWAANIKDAPEYYPDELVIYIIPSYIIIWILSVYFSGGYDRPVKYYRIVRGLLIGTLIISALYGFLPETLRFSRALILLGSAWSMFSMITIRLLFNILLGKNIQVEDKQQRKIIIAGSETEGKRALGLLTEAGVNYRFLGFVLPENEFEKKENILGTVDELQDICSLYQPDEIIFCSKDIAHSHIINQMTLLGPQLNYKIIPENSMSIIGSNSKNTAGDLYAIDINLNINTPMSRRNKRVFDILVSLMCLLLSPFLLFFVKKPSAFIINIFSVLFGKKTWVGYAPTQVAHENIALPALRKGILTPLDAHPDKTFSEATKARINLLYAKDYEMANDWEIFRKGWRKAGNT
jgi:GT2 family glycosyltransferase